MPFEQRVLIAESDETLRRRLHARLLDLNLFSDCVSTCYDAIEHLSKQEYGFVLLDLALPPDAVRVLSHLENMHRKPIVVVIAERGAALTVDAEVVQIVARRPVKAGELAQMVSSCLRAVNTADKRVSEARPDPQPRRSDDLRR